MEGKKYNRTGNAILPEEERKGFCEPREFVHICTKRTWL